MDFDLSKIEFSKNDINRGLKLPEVMTPKLAEDIGIMVGDGCISVYKRKRDNSTIDYEIRVFGHLISDRAFIHYTKRLKTSLFNLDFRYGETISDTTCHLRIRSKGLVQFYNKIIGLPIGSKDDIHIPQIIIDGDKNTKRAFLMGLSATDFALCFKKKGKNELHYPVFKLGTSSRNFVLDLQRILCDLGFKTSISLYQKRIHPKTIRPFTTHSLELSGKDNLQKWVREIGFNNHKYELKYDLWKKNGFCPPDKEVEKIIMMKAHISI